MYTGQSLEFGYQSYKWNSISGVTLINKNKHENLNVVHKSDNGGSN